MVQVQELTCVHRWILSQPSRGSISGTCRHCGARKNYPAGIQLPPPPEEDEEPEEEVELDLEALAASIATMERSALV